jgi:hypothetical protein
VRSPARATAALLVAAVACYHPNAEVGQPCSPVGDDCPSGQHCDQMLSPPTCVVVDPSGDAGPDAPIDAPVVACATGSACPPEEPVCDPMSGLCRGCRGDAECTTAACEESTGACIASDQVVYVAAAGAAGNACTMAAPCATIAQGVAATTTGRTFVAIAPGTYNEAVQLQGAAAAVLSGPGSGAVATLLGITMLNAPATLVIESLHVAAAAGACIQLQSSATAVTLYGDDIGPCSGDGVDVQGALVVERCDLVGSGGGNGIAPMGGTTGGSGVQLDVEQTAIDQFGTAIDVSNGSYVIRNDLLSRSSSVALRLHAMGVTGGPGIVDFVTIVGGANRAISCNANGGGTGSAAITSSLFAENTEDPSIDSTCLVSYSVWDDSSTPMGSNDGSGEAPVFVDPNTGDFHLAAGSPGINAADPNSTTTVDLEGAPRPSGGGFDCGALQGQ